jgi:hypothetical protein
MKTEHPNRNIPGLIAEQKQITAEVASNFASLTAEQLNWKPNADQWSVGQCFDHLLNTNKTYFSEIDKIINGNKKSTVWEKLPFLPGFFGRFLINATEPNNVKKLKAPGAFAPSASSVDPTIIVQFVESQHSLMDRMQETMGKPAHKLIVTSGAARFVTYSLLDAYVIMANHNRRHLNQAKRVLESIGFPVKTTAGAINDVVAV